MAEKQSAGVNPPEEQPHQSDDESLEDKKKGGPLLDADGTIEIELFETEVALNKKKREIKVATR